jgi:hypothetical protein
MADTTFGTTPGISGINFGGGGGGPFGNVTLDPSQLPDDFGDVRDVAGDVLRDEGGDILRSIGSEFGVNVGNTSGGTPTGNQRLNFSEPTGDQSSGSPVAPVDSGGFDTALYFVAGMAALFGVLAFSGTIDL